MEEQRRSSWKTVSSVVVGWRRGDIDGPRSPTFPLRRLDESLDHSQNGVVLTQPLGEQCEQLAAIYEERRPPAPMPSRRHRDLAG